MGIVGKADFTISILENNVSRRSHTKFIEPSDIQGHWAYADMLTLLKQGVISGYPDGTIKPDAYITRGEGDWAYESVKALVENRTISGYEDNTLRPKARVTRAEVFVMLNRARNKF